MIINSSGPVSKSERKSYLDSMSSEDHLSVPAIMDRTRRCITYVHSRTFIRRSVSPEEEQFPIAYSIAIQNGAGDFEKTLLPLFQPQNTYCIHLRDGTDQATQLAISAIVRCFKNVFFSTTNSSEYGKLNAELRCGKELLQHMRWEYFINIDDNMFPLKTNWELVMILKALNSSSIMHVNRYSILQLSLNHDTFVVCSILSWF